MSNNASITIIGNVTGEPELRFTPNGAAVCNFSVAVNERRKNAQGEWEDGEATFWRVNVWRDQAENDAESIAKGTRVVVLGQARSRSWETPERDKGTGFEVTADEVPVALRCATAKVERTNRGSSSGGGGSRPASSGGSWTHDEPPF